MDADVKRLSDSQRKPYQLVQYFDTVCHSLWVNIPWVTVLGQCGGTQYGGNNLSAVWGQQSLGSIGVSSLEANILVANSPGTTVWGQAVQGQQPGGKQFRDNSLGANSPGTSLGGQTAWGQPSKQKEKKQTVGKQAGGNSS